MIDVFRTARGRWRSLCPYFLIRCILILFSSYDRELCILVFRTKSLRFYGFHILFSSSSYVFFLYTS